MAVVISEIVTEVVVDLRDEPGSPAAVATASDEMVEVIVRRSAERVLEILRREWDR